jgi:hypothetical protein
MEFYGSVFLREKKMQQHFCVFEKCVAHGLDQLLEK